MDTGATRMDTSTDGAAGQADRGVFTETSPAGDAAAGDRATGGEEEDQGGCGRAVAGATGGPRFIWFYFALALGILCCRRRRGVDRGGSF